MRVAIITENFLPKVDGVTRTLSRLLEHLQGQGHDVLLLGPDSGMTEYAGATIMGTFGIPFLPYPELKLNLWRPGFTKALLEFRPHVIHLVDPVWLGAAGLAVCRFYLPGVPLVSSYHTNLAAYCGHFGWGFLSSVMWRWNRLCHAFSRFVACPSRSTREMLQQQGFKHLRIWPRGVDPHLFSPNRRSQKLRAQWMGVSELEARRKAVILYVGRVSFEKNLGLVVEAYKGMDHQRCHLVIVGHGPAFNDIQAECIRSNTPVTFTGYLQGADLAAAYASADIFAFPSVTETFGQVVLESMASGLPVVGLWAEGVRDLVEHGQTGLLLDVDGLSSSQEVQGYRKLLMSLVDHPDKRQRMGHLAAEKAKQYTWWEAIECMTRMYRDAIGDSSSSTSSEKDDTTLDNDTAGDSGIEEDFAREEDNCNDKKLIEMIP